MVTLSIDDVEIKAESGEKILWVALDNEIYIPNLCAIRGSTEASSDFLPFGGCRLCLVEVEVNSNERKLLPACSTSIKDGMKVYTKTEKVNRLRRTAFELIMSDHKIDCKNCDKRRNCELIKIANYLKIKLEPKRFKKIVQDFPIDDSHPQIIFDPNKCVICGKCVSLCENGFFNFVRRGFETRISAFFDLSVGKIDCKNCLKCIEFCPVGAIVKKLLA